MQILAWLLHISFVVMTLFFELAAQPFITFDIHYAGHFGIVHLRSSQWEKFMTATIPNTHPGWAFTLEVLSFGVILKGNYNYLMSLSLAPEGSLEKKPWIYSSVWMWPSCSFAKWNCSITSKLLMQFVCFFQKQSTNPILNKSDSERRLLEQ